MTTGAPIYLVSACTSGEEFVAAFRRYTDRHGVFVPIGEPLPVGCKGRFALTLEDGGVMLEGEAEVVSSAKTPSVTHGRVGMTLRFVEPDDASKILLVELEKARLAMRPQPPSVPPRPAQLPAEPRPVPPAPLGRVDAVNALAECVAIGDVSALAGASVPPKASQKFVVPSIPPMGGTRSTGSVPAIDRKPPTQPSPIVPPAVRPDAKAELLATQRGPAPGPTGNEPPAPPPSRAQRMATPFAPLPIVTRKPSPSTPPPISPPPTPTPPPRMATPAAPLPIVQAPMVPVVAAPRPAVPEVEIAEPTEISAIPQAPEPEPESTTSKGRIKRETRKTVMGVAVVPSGVKVLPATPTPRVPHAEVPRDTTEMSAEEQTSTGTSLDELLAPSNAVGDEADAKVIPPTVEEATPSGDWTMTPGATGPTIVPTRPATPRPVADAPSQPVDAAPGDSRPAEDWLIALDPSRPDGWSEPSKVEKPPAGVLPPGPPVSAVASAEPLDSSHASRAEPPTASTGPKVQIDPTLIEPLQPLPDDEQAQSGPVTTPLVAYVQPPQQPVAMAARRPLPGMPLAIPTPAPAMVPATMPPGAVPQVPGSTGSNTAYPERPVSSDPQAMLQTHRVRAPSASGMSMDGISAPPRDPTSLTLAVKRKRMIVILASAGLAVLIGIVLLVILGRGKATQPTVAPAVKAPVAAPTPPGKTPSPSAAEVAPPIDAGAAIAPSPTAVAEATCVLDVVTAPPGAEVFLEGNQIVGPSPTKVTLPCGVAAKISARKKLFQTATRVIKPAHDAKKPVKLVLSRITFAVKVSSVPAGATITHGAKVLGVTPTNVRLNAFEPATLTIKKDGYAPETQKITPKQNNQTVHATLKRIAVKRGR